MYNVILEQNGVTKIAIFGLQNEDTPAVIKDYRDDPMYKGHNIRVQEIKEVCMHDDTIFFSQCCGRQQDNIEESDICLDCGEHTDFSEYCVTCDGEI